MITFRDKQIHPLIMKSEIMARLPFLVAVFITAILVNTVCGGKKKNKASTSAGFHLDDEETYKNAIMDTRNEEGPWSHKDTKNGIAVYSVKGRGPSMANRYRVIEDGEYLAFAVFDGIRGTETAERAVQELLPYLINALKDPGWSKERPEDVLIEMLDRYAENAAEWNGESGCTVLVGIRHKNILYMTNIGDSAAIGRVTWTNGTGETMWFAEEHKMKVGPPPAMDEFNRVTEKIFENGLDKSRSSGPVPVGGRAAWLTNGHKIAVTRKGWRINKLYTTRAIGPVGKKEKWLSVDPDVTVVYLDDISVDFVVVGTKALWNMFSKATVAKFISEHMKAEYYGAQKLTEAVHERSRRDDLTVLVMKFPKRTT